MVQSVAEFTVVVTLVFAPWCKASLSLQWSLPRGAKGRDTGLWCKTLAEFTVILAPWGKGSRHWSLPHGAKRSLSLQWSLPRGAKGHDTGLCPMVQNVR
jgi:hypothetical protein